MPLMFGRGAWSSFLSHQGNTIFVKASRHFFGRHSQQPIHHGWSSPLHEARRLYETRPFSSVRSVRENAESLEDIAQKGVLGASHGTSTLEGRLTTFPGAWLRDLCSCPECMNPDTKQRRINVFKQPSAGLVTQARVFAGGVCSEVTFKDRHVSTFGWDVCSPLKKPRKVDRSYEAKLEHRHWDASVAGDPPRILNDDVQTRTGMARMTKLIREYGFCFVVQSPPTPEATQTLLERIGPIRNTHYGGFYDFTSDLSSKDTAYTSESLEPHTDNTYFTEPAGLQALHLISHTGGSGGESSLVDGFNAARVLYERDPEAYRILSQVGVQAHASGNAGICILPAEPVPVLSHTRFNEELMQVRWNTADRAGITASESDEMEAWYRAAAKWDAILSDPKQQYWFQLEPGTVLIFDNWRVLHGRNAFTGKRRMCGGYINRDDFVSRYRMTNMDEGESAQYNPAAGSVFPGQ